MFQSSPTPKGGRYSRNAMQAWGLWCFNPRPPRKVGATLSAAIERQLLNVSNPRPPRKVGATRDIVGRIALVPLFQSSPTPKGGRYLRNLRDRELSITVSIPRHPERWALRRGDQKYTGRYGFQSSPTPKGGRYDFEANRGNAGQNVSILAHPERWALLW